MASEIIRPSGNVNALWSANSFSLIDEVVINPAAGSADECIADDADDNEEQIWSFPSLASLTTATSVTVHIYHSDDGISADPPVAVRVKVGGVWSSPQDFSYSGTVSWDSNSYAGTWVASDFDDFEVGVTAPSVLGSGDRYLLRTLYAEVDDTVASVEVTVDHDTEALLQADLTVDHDTEALLQSEIGIDHDTEALLKGGIGIEHYSEAYLVDLETIEHTTDAYLVMLSILGHSTDALMIKSFAQHNTDVLLKIPRQISGSGGIIRIDGIQGSGNALITRYRSNPNLVDPRCMNRRIMNQYGWGPVQVQTQIFKPCTIRK